MGERSAPSLVIHIGPRKTGTTAIQHVFAARRETLRTLGVVYPGAVRQHFMAANRLMGRRQLWEEDHERPASERPWRDLMVEIDDAPFGVISTEVLSQARPQHIRRILDAAEGRAPIVVITYRPFDELLTSTWQQLVKEGLRDPLDEWSRRAVVEYPESSGAPFPRVLDLASLVETWGQVVGYDNVNVVVVDRASPNLIFEAFEQLLSLPSGSLSSEQGGPRKRSLTVEEAELLRQVNLRVPRDRQSLKRHRHVLRMVAAWLNEHPPASSDRAIALPPDVVEAARNRSKEMLARLTAVEGQISVFGDLGSLAAAGPGRSAAPAPPVAPTTVDLGVAADWLSGLVDRLPVAE
jgi:hypothetical protein